MCAGDGWPVLIQRVQLLPEADFEAGREGFEPDPEGFTGAAADGEPLAAPVPLALVTEATASPPLVP